MLLFSDGQYVLRDTAKNTSSKDKSAFVLVSKRDDVPSDKAVTLAAGGGADTLEEESGTAGK